MGWHIQVIENSVEINDDIAFDLLKCGSEICFTWMDELGCFNENEPTLLNKEALDEIVIYDNKLYFNYDHMEHMDYIEEPKIQEVLKKHRVKGDICFGSLDGDNAGEFWGYRFDGEGNITKLKGEIDWEYVTQS